MDLSLNFSEQSGGMLAELAVVGTKGGEKMGVDVEFAGNFTVDETGTTISDLVSREQAGRVGSNVVNDNGFTCRRSRPADALIKWDAVSGVMVPWKGPAALVCLCQQRLRKRRPSESESQVLGANWVRGVEVVSSKFPFFYGIILSV